MSTTIPQNKYIYDNTRFFAQRFGQTICDMTGQEFIADEKSMHEGAFSTDFSFLTFIHFSGNIQGDYVVALTEQTAARIIGAWEEGMTPEDLAAIVDDISEFIKEALNTAVGQAIVELEKNFGNLTFISASTVFGKIKFPQVMSGSIKLNGEPGQIMCAFLLNMANLKIGQQLEDTLKDLEKKSREANEARKNVESILQLFPAGLVAINEQGIVLPGHSSATIDVVGLPKNTQIVEQQISTILAASESQSSDLEKWLGVVFEKFEEIPFKQLVELCPVQEFVNSRRKLLKCNWLPVASEEKVLEKLLVVIEDITQQRAMEENMKEIKKAHDTNLELISQVINLTPDEVTAFVYDTSSMLSDAQSLVKSNNRDREFLNAIFRTFHTIKGTSGHFQFKSLQDLAHSIEDQLRQYRDGESISIDETAIGMINESINDVKGYINRIEDLRAKLGKKDETIKTKAERMAPSVMVELEEIDRLNLSMQQIIEKGRRANYDPYFTQQIADIALDLKKLRQIKLSFFAASFQSLIDNTCKNVNKQVDLKIGTDINIDVDIIRKLHNSIIHLINNAIDHGIETVEIRTAANKRVNGLLILSGKVIDNYLEISLEDDGAGINEQVVRNKLIKTGRFTPEQVENISSKELYTFLFEPGFTTKEQATIISGRGVGMDIVKKAVEELKGTVEIHSKSGKGTKIIIRVSI